MAEINDKLDEIKRQKDTYIVPENLKEGVTAFGVTGSLPDYSTIQDEIDDLEANKMPKNTIIIDSSIDLNDLTEDGRYFNLNANSVTNKPPYATANVGYIEVFAPSDTVILQRWTEYQTSTVWERQKASTWGSWKIVSKEKNIITAGSSAGVTIQTAGANKLTLNRTIGQIGDKLSISNGKVVIGAGIHHILLSAMGTMRINSIGAKNIMIYKNESEFLINMNSFNSVSGTENKCLNISPRIVEVQQGDTFELYFYLSVGEYIYPQWERTYLNIEVLD